MAKKSKALRVILKDPAVMFMPILMVASFIDSTCVSPGREEAKEAMKLWRRRGGWPRSVIREAAKELGQYPRRSGSERAGRAVVSKYLVRHGPPMFFWW